jgi:hypothetical protein
MITKINNLIFKTSSKIFNLKEKMLYASFFKSILIIFQILFLEITLTLISIPIYFSSHETSSHQGYSNFKKRKVLTFSILIILFAIWSIKLIIYFQNTGDKNKNYSIELTDQNTNNSGILNTDSLIALLNNEKNTDLTKPIITNIIEENNSIIVEGSSSPFKTVLLSIKNNEEDNFTLLTSVTNETGNFTCDLKNLNINFKKGTYLLSAITVDKNLSQISETSDSYPLEIEKEQDRSLLSQIDYFLNIFLMGYLAISIISIILIL